MVGNSGRHQQLVGGRRSGALAVLLCLVVASLALLWGHASLRDARVASNDNEAGAIEDSESGRADVPCLRSESSEPVGDGLAMTQGGFLDRLALSAESSAEGDSAVHARVSWNDARLLPEAAADLLRSYQEIPTARLALSGYLDIKGNVWGAIVRDGRGWVDLVLVAADEGDVSCRLRAQRLVPPKTVEEEP